MKKILVLLACLWGSIGLAIVPKSVLALSSTYFGACAAKKERTIKNSEQLTAEDSAKVNARLQSLYDRGLLRCRPDNISMAYGNRFATFAWIKPALFVKKDEELSEFTALHEARHINGMHSLFVCLIPPMIACAIFRKGWSPSIIRNILRVTSVPGISGAINFANKKHNEIVSDVYAAENCSNAKDFKNAIKRYDDNESQAMHNFMDYYKGDKLARTVLYLIDPHMPLTGHRADILQKIYDRRVVEGSLK